jgi:aminoglycoside phosphotransferase (APT) family kinase protein
MARVRGAIPSDVPSWHKRGWAADLSAIEQQALHDNALSALIELHQIDTTRREFAFLESDTADTPLRAYVAEVAKFYEWCRPVLRYGTDVIEEAIRYVVNEVPDDDRRSIVWGDARVGNIIFADDLSVAAMLDWEGASLGPPEIDVAWWVMFDEYLCEANGLQRLPGVPDRLATYRRYEAIGGSELSNIGYYDVLAGLQFALINSRLADLLIRTGRASESIASELVTRVTSMTERALRQLA